MFLGSISSASARIFSRSKKVTAETQQPAAPVDMRELARRTVPRDAVEFHTKIGIDTVGDVDARIMDISPYGMQARASSRILERGERITVMLPLSGTAQADIMWGLKGLFGCKFVDPIDPDLYTEMLSVIRTATFEIEPAESPAGEQSDGGIPLE